MIHTIDWLSFTVSVKPNPSGSLETLNRTITRAVGDLLGCFDQILFVGGILVVGGGRAPYSASFTFENSGVMKFGHPNLNHALVEISGRGCEHLSELDNAPEVLLRIAPHLTRIDLATDILCDLSPADFIRDDDKGRFSSRSEILSDTGHTFYVGSRKSDRYCRIYRYYPPHPRAHLLRIEFVLKAEQARLASRSLLKSGLASYTAGLGEVFGFRSSAWSPGRATDADVRAWRPERQQASTVRWILTQCVPAMVRAHNDDLIDVRALYNEKIAPFLDESANMFYDTNLGDFD